MELRQYIAGLAFEEPDAFAPEGGFRPMRTRGPSDAAVPDQNLASAGLEDAAVDVGAVLAFTEKVSAQERMDVLESVQLAQRAASGLFNRFNATEAWYGKFIEVLERVGWVPKQMAFAKHDQKAGDLQMDKQALKILGALASQGALGILTQALAALENAADSNGSIKLLEQHATGAGSGNFQMGAVDRVDGGGLCMSLGAFYFHSHDQRRRLIFLTWGGNEVQFWSSAQQMELNGSQYAMAREAVREKLGNPAEFIRGLGPLG